MLRTFRSRTPISSHRSPWVAMSFAVVLLGAASFAQESQPVFLDEPEPPPKPKVIQSAKKAPLKNADGSLRAERDVVRFSDDTVVNHGAYVEYYGEDRKFAEGAFTYGVHDGEWTFWHPNGQVCKKVNFRIGRPHGSWEVFDKNGKITHKKSYADGRRDGQWVVYFPGTDQPKLEMNYKEGQVEGERVTYFANGKVQQRSTFKAGKRNGPAVEWDESGRKRAELNFVDGKLDGNATFWESNGVERSRTYKNGELLKRN